MDLDENRSVWIAEQPPYEPLPALRGCEVADVAIIGGGFTGVSTAWHLSGRYPGRRVVLLEAKTLANGASGRSGGQALTGMNLSDDAAPDAIRRRYEVTRRGIDIIERWVKEYSLSCGFSRRGSLQIFTYSAAAEAAHGLVESWRGAGVPVEWRAGSTVGLVGARGAVADPAAGRVNGVGLLRGMRPVLLRQGVSVWEHTPVVKVEEGRTIRLVTPAGEVRAATVILATNAYTPALGYFRDGILPLHSHVVATVPLSDEQWSGLGWGESDGFSDDRARIGFGSRTANGRFLFGGGSNAAYAYRYGGEPVFPDSFEGAKRSFDAVGRQLRDYFPGLARVPIEHRWTGTIALTFDRVCSMGVRGEHRNVFYALGYSGHGIALATLAGEVLSDLYSDDHAPWRDLPFYQRPLPRIPPEPWRWIGYQIYTRLTGRSPRR